MYSSNHPILIKFRQLVVNIVIKKLQMVFLTSTVINSNGNMEELERKFKCEKVDVSMGYFIFDRLSKSSQEEENTITFRLKCIVIA